MQIPSAALCVHPLAQLAIPVLIAAGLAHAIVLWQRPRLGSPLAILAYPALAMAVLWLGWYRVSPLGFSSGRVPLLSGYLVAKPHRGLEPVGRREVISMGAGTALGIQPVLLPGPTKCIWSSTTGGAFDDPTSCATVYASEGDSPYDILRLHITSACGIPPVSANVRLSIMP